MDEVRPWRKAAALALAAALVLSGCGGTGDEKQAQATPAPAESAEPTPEERDYSKYNAYIDMAEELDDAEEVLNAYFQTVDYSETFTVLEGGEYADIKDAFQFYISNTYPVTEALEYVDVEPVYPSVDAAVRALGDSPVQVMDALDAIAGYVRFHDYEDDNLAQAPQLHADLWKALEIYDTYYGDFMNAISEMVEQGREDDEAELLEDGNMILYHSSCMIHAAQDILSGLDDQVYAAYMEAAVSGAETFEYPVIDTMEFAPLFEKLQTGYDGFTEAIASEEEKEKVFSNKKQAESSVQLFTSRVNSLYSYMTALSQALAEGSDYADAWDNASEALSSMITVYNSMI